MVDAKRRSQIADRLGKVKAEHDVTVLYACESGSRAWGFPSADSDYDVRLVYAHPRDWYLSIDVEQRDDTIDPAPENDIDLHGWDLRKALRLFRVANPTLLEWMQSPIVYHSHDAVMTRWRDLIPDYYAPGAVGPAYRGMARSVAEQNLTEAPIPHKAYLYVLRALLTVRWIEQKRSTIPLEFDRLLNAADLEADLQTAIDDLLDQKRSGLEQDAGPRLSTIHAFIEAELERQADIHFPEPETRPPTAPLNTFFRNVLERASAMPPS